TTPRSVGGTPQYMAPEQFEGIIDSQSDQYALGGVVYELLTGRLPMTVDGGKQQGKSLLSTVASEQTSQEQPLWQEQLRWAMQHAQTRPQRPGRYNPTLSLPTELAILKALAKEPGDRHPDVATFVKALRSPFYDPTMYQQIKEEWLQEGDCLYKAQRYPEALAVYQWVVQIGAQDIEVHRRIAQVYVKQGQDEQAWRICEKIVHFAPDDVHTRLLQADIFYRGGYFREALAACDEVLRLAPGNQAVLRYEVEIFHKSQQWLEALTICERLLQLVPDDVSVLRLKVEILYGLRRYPGVLETCKEVLRLLPADPVACWYKTDALSKWGHELFEQKQYQEAGEAYEQAVQRDTRDIITWCNRGEIFFRARDYSPALASYKRAWQLSKNCESEQETTTRIAASIGMAETLRALAKTLQTQGNKAEASRLQEKAARLDKERQKLFLE
ncbi:MAG: tetratricopeptide repeat protein, partial [Ktedonobacteraceae bacterium]